jgi:cation diffusion facilitator family transporter
LLDFAAAFLLAWVVHLAQTPGDARHPMGHERAEPLGALAIAALAGVLALEVGSSAIGSLLGTNAVVFAWELLWLFVFKAVFKAIIFYLARGGKGPALSALSVDARNDVIVCLVAIVGYFGAQAGYARLDALLAVPAAAWIAWSGVGLARENIDLLMGIAPPDERQRQLLQIAASVSGVVEAHDLVAHSTGTAYALQIHITVNENLTVRQGRDLGELVRSQLLAQPDVSHCSVHVDPTDPS